MIFQICWAYYNYLSAMHRIYIPAGAIVSATHALNQSLDARQKLLVLCIF